MRRAYQAAAAGTVEGMDIAGQLTPEHLYALRSVVEDFRSELVSDGRTSDQRSEAEAFLRGTAVVIGRLVEGYSACDMVCTTFRVFGQDAEATLGAFFEFVDTFDLFFRPGSIPTK